MSKEIIEQIMKEFKEKRTFALNGHKNVYYIQVVQRMLEEAIKIAKKEVIDERHRIHKINLECARNGAKLNEFNRILKDKGGFWINAITKELCYRQRIIGKIKVEDGKITMKPSKV